MLVKRIILKNFRNYASADVNLQPGKTILIGDNAQGKTNLLEAVELAATGKSRAAQDADLVRWTADGMLVEIHFVRQGLNECVSIALVRPNAGEHNGKRGTEKRIKINGITQTSVKSLWARLAVVSFKSEDLSLLRAGPRARRDWLDSIILRLRPAFYEVMANYQKILSQRNRLLKTIFEKGGRLSVTDRDQLKVWDQQLAQFGARLIKARVGVLERLLPGAADRQQHLSGKREILSAKYVFRIQHSERESMVADEEPSLCYEDREKSNLAVLSGANLHDASEDELAAQMAAGLRQMRYEEIGRKQTLLGPHRDDIVFTLNEASATDFASQGQQRSLVLSLKLSEMDLVTDTLGESPVLLLDDVLAELDVSRQSLLLSAVKPEMQTMITTTHLSDFEPRWLSGAAVLSVAGGGVTAEAPGLRHPFA